MHRTSRTTCPSFVLSTPEFGVRRYYLWDRSLSRGNGVLEITVLCSRRLIWSLSFSLSIIMFRARITAVVAVAERADVHGSGRVVGFGSLATRELVCIILTGENCSPECAFIFRRHLIIFRSLIMCSPCKSNFCKCSLWRHNYNSSLHKNILKCAHLLKFWLWHARRSKNTQVSSFCQFSINQTLFSSKMHARNL